MSAAGTRRDTKFPDRSELVAKASGDGKELAPGIGFRWYLLGSFMMGAPKTPMPVKLTQGYWMGEIEAIISRSAFRNHDPPSNLGSDLGFRVACVQVSKK